MITLEDFKQALREHFGAYDALGRTGSYDLRKDEREFDALPAELKAKMPSFYVAYMRAVLRSGQDVHVGSDWIPYYLPKLHAWAEDIVRDNDPELIDEMGFVFFMHQGYQFYFIKKEDLGQPNPPVWFYLEGRGLRLEATSFSHWAIGLMDTELDTYRKIDEIRKRIDEREHPEP